MTATRQKTKAEPMIKPPRRVSSLEAMLKDLCCVAVEYGSGLGTTLDDGRCIDGRVERGRKARIHIVAEERGTCEKVSQFLFKCENRVDMDVFCADYPK